MKKFTIFYLFLLTALFTQNKSKTSFDRLDQQSLCKLFNYCKIYHDKNETTLAKQQILHLINKHRQIPLDGNIEIQMPTILIDQIVSVFQNKEDKSLALSKYDHDFFLKSRTTYIIRS